MITTETITDLMHEINVTKNSNLLEKIASIQFKMIKLSNNRSRLRSINIKHRLSASKTEKPIPIQSNRLKGSFPAIKISKITTKTTAITQGPRHE